MGIDHKEKLVLVSNPKITCTVGIGKQQVVYEGQRFDWLYQLAVKLDRWKPNDPSAPEQFAIKGKDGKLETLAARRKKHAG